MKILILSLVLLLVLVLYWYFKKRKVVTTTTTTLPVSSTTSTTLTTTLTTTLQPDSGWCYTVGIPSHELSLNGEFLEVQYVPYGQEVPIWISYNSILTLFDDDPNFTTFLLCGNSSGVQFRYGSGPAFVNYGWIISTCANCCDEETPCKP